MDEKLDRIEAKIDRLVDRQASQSQRLLKAEIRHVQNSKDLAEHMRRTEVTEKRLDEIERLKYYVTGGLIIAALLFPELKELILSLKAGQ